MLKDSSTARVLKIPSADFRYESVIPAVSGKPNAVIAGKSEGIIYGTLLMLIGFAAVPLGSIEPWWSGFFEAAIFIIGVFAILVTIGRHWKVHAVLVPFLALLVLACIQVVPLYLPTASHASHNIISLNPFETGRFAIRLTAAVLLLAMLLQFTVSRSRLLMLANLIVIIGAASAVLAIWRRIFPDTTFASLWNSRNYDFGQFTNRNHFTLLMEMSIGPTLSLGLCAYGARRFLYFDVVLLMCLAFVLANSRAGIIGMIVQLTTMFWIYFGSSISRSFRAQPSSASNHNTGPRFWRAGQEVVLRSVFVLLLLSAISASVVWLGGESVRERLESVPEEFVPRNGVVENVNPRRLEIWAATWKLIEAHPILGAGLGAYKTAIPQYLTSSGNWEPQQAHNEYLELTAGGGILGAAIGFWFIVILIKESRRQLFDRDNMRKALCRGALVGLVGVAIHSMVDFGLHITVNTLVCCCLITLATAKMSSHSVSFSKA